MHVNFGIVPPLETHVRDKARRRAELAARAERDFDAYLDARSELFPASGQ